MIPSIADNTAPNTDSKYWWVFFTGTLDTLMSTGATATLIPYCDRLHYTRIVELKF
jgi:hypothetical protein